MSGRRCSAWPTAALGGLAIRAATIPDLALLDPAGRRSVAVEVAPTPSGAQQP